MSSLVAIAPPKTASVKPGNVKYHFSAVTENYAVIGRQVDSLSGRLQQNFPDADESAKIQFCVSVRKCEDWILKAAADADDIRAKLKIHAPQNDEWMEKLSTMDTTAASVHEKIAALSATIGSMVPKQVAFRVGKKYVVIK